MIRAVSLIGLLTVLSGCAPSIAELRQQPPDHTATFVSTPDQVSHCAMRALEENNSYYTYRLSHDPNHREFLLTVTRTSDALTLQQLAVMELRFLHIPTGTQAELRGNWIDGWGLAKEQWPLVQRCGQQSLPQ